jgi:multiple sugar transport system permease protein
MPGAYRTVSFTSKAILFGPAALWLFAFSIFPLVYSLTLSFRRWSVATRADPPWVGFDNYVRLWGDERFWASVKTTAVYIFPAATLECVLGVALALLLWKPPVGKRLFRAIAVIPVLLAPVVVGYMFRLIFHESGGPVNGILRLLNWPQVNWLSDPGWAMISIIIVDVWQWTPFVGLLALAALEGVPEDIIEAARVDGAGAIPIFWRVILPIISPILWVTMILRLVDLIRVLDVIFVVTRGGPGTSTEVIGFYNYLTGFRSFDLSFAAALSWGVVILSILITRPLLRFTRSA